MSQAERGGREREGCCGARRVVRRGRRASGGAGEAKEMSRGDAAEDGEGEQSGGWPRVDGEGAESEGAEPPTAGGTREVTEGAPAGK